MCHMPQNKIFKKVKILSFFLKKGGLRGLSLCHLPPKKIVKISKKFVVFFSKRKEVKGVKKSKF